MRKKDGQRLLEIAVALNVGDEVHARHMTERLWRVRRWAAEQTWRAEAAKDDARRGILEQLGASVDDALHALERLKAQADAPVAAPAAVAPAAETPKPADVDGPLVPKTVDDKVDLAVKVANSGVVA